jgi:hypothetical protein
MVEETEARGLPKVVREPGWVSAGEDPALCTAEGAGAGRGQDRRKAPASGDGGRGCAGIC